jgi:predicted nucleic acid-binding protein
MTPRYYVDANILIDLLNGGLLETAFRLPLEFVTTDVVAAELKRGFDRDKLHDLGLQVYSLDEEMVQEIAALRSRYGGLSIGDLSVLVMAQHLLGVILTNEARLRHTASRYHIIVHGVLWLLDELVSAGLLRPLEAAEALDKILVHGARLPAKECQKRREVWLQARLFE